MSVKKKSNLLIFLCWFIYTAAYCSRYSYTANVASITAHYGLLNADAGLVSTCFFFIYGAGQIVNGLLCKRYPKRLLLALALLTSSVVNIVLAFGIPFSYFKYLWLVNGLAQSFLWSSLILILGENLSSTDLRKAVFIMSTTVMVGTTLSYGVSALFTRFGSFFGAFAFGGAVTAIAATVWFFFYPQAVSGKTEELITQNKEAQERGKIPTAVLVTAILLAAFAVADNFVKDGLITWVPSILIDQYGVSESLSVFVTLFLPVVAIVGTTAVSQLHKKIPSFVLLCGLFFLISSVFLGGVLLLLETPQWVLVLICFCFVSCCMSGINNVITGMAPLYLRKHVNPGLLSGLLDGCCYVGSALSSYGLGAFSDLFGWGKSFYLLLGVCLVPVVCSIALAAVSRKKPKEGEKTE